MYQKAADHIALKNSSSLYGAAGLTKTPWGESGPVEHQYPERRLYMMVTCSRDSRLVNDKPNEKKKEIVKSTSGMYL